MWANHHAIFQYVCRADRYFLLVNVGFLMLISFLPFPTAVLAAHLDEGSERRTAVLFYGATVWCIALAFNAVWWYAVRRGLLDPAAESAAPADAPGRPHAAAASTRSTVRASTCVIRHLVRGECGPPAAAGP